MNRQDIVKIMCDVVNNLNYQVAQQQGISAEDAYKAIEGHQEQLQYVNNVLLDELIKKEIIQIEVV